MYFNCLTILYNNVLNTKGEEDVDGTYVYKFG